MRLFTHVTRVLVFTLLFLWLVQPKIGWAQDETPPNAPHVVGGQESEIVGGHPADPGEWGWQVLLNAQLYRCGGVLIAEEWVVTAAHCVFDTQGERIAVDQMSVVVGEYNRYLREGTEQVIAVAEVFAHENYARWSNDNDIALLHLATPAALINGVTTVPLLSDEQLPLSVAGQLATVTGWGRTSEGGATSNILMEVTVPIVANEICNNSYGIITKNMLCAGYADGGLDACQGDSGGPLVVADEEGSWYLVGIVSFGYGCAQPTYYGVYTRVSQYDAWIALLVATHARAGDDTQPDPPTDNPDPVSDDALPGISTQLLFLLLIMR